MAKKHMKSCPSSVIRENKQNHNEMSHHIQQYKHNFKKTVTQTAEDTEKLEPSCIVGGNIKCCSCFGRQFGSSSRSETIELLIGPTNSTLGTYPRHKN